MAILTFKGGIHPKEGKNLTKNKSIAEYKPHGEIAIPISQHIGAPAEVIVNVGDKVVVGQLIAKASGFMSANIHASVSGTVKAIEKRMVAAGNTCPCIIIDNDFMFEEGAPLHNLELEDMSKEAVIGIIKDAGIVGMGGACFPTHVKLSPKEPEKIEYIIVNGAECEPYLTSDYRRMKEEPEKIIEGLKIVLSLFDNAKGIIAIEDNKMDVVVNLKKLTREYKNISVKEVFTKYPQGGERALIKAVTGRKINSSMLPSDVGCIVQNVDTIYEIYNAVINKKPLTERVVTITGDAVRKPLNYLVPIGTNFDELIEDVGGFKRPPKKIISGGPMMGMAVSQTNLPVMKGSSSLLCFLEDETEVEETNCISCGRCANACPGRIVPSLVAKAAVHGDKEQFVKLNGMECCECGCCSYVCPAKKNLTQTIKSMRKEILADRRKQNNK